VVERREQGERWWGRVGGGRVGGGRERMRGGWVKGVGELKNE